MVSSKFMSLSCGNVSVELLRFFLNMVLRCGIDVDKYKDGVFRQDTPSLFLLYVCLDAYQFADSNSLRKRTSFSENILRSDT